MIRKTFLLSALLSIIPAILGMDANQYPIVQSSLYSSSSLAAAAAASAASMPKENPTSVILASSSSRKRSVEEKTDSDRSIHVDKHSRALIKKPEQDTQVVIVSSPPIVPVLAEVSTNSGNPSPKISKLSRGLKRLRKPTGVVLKNIQNSPETSDDDSLSELLDSYIESNKPPLYMTLENKFTASSSGISGIKRSLDSYPDSYIEGAASPVETVEIDAKRICADVSLKTNSSLSQPDDNNSCSLYSQLQNPYVSSNGEVVPKRRLDEHASISVEDITSELDSLALDEKRRRILLPLENETFLLPSSQDESDKSSAVKATLPTIQRQEKIEEKQLPKYRCLTHQTTDDEVSFSRDALPLISNMNDRFAADEVYLSSMHSPEEVDQWLDQRENTKSSWSQPTKRLISVYRSLNADALKCQKLIEELKVLDNPVALVHAHGVLERTSQLWNMYCTKFYKTSEKIVPLNLDIFQMTTILNDLKTKKMLLKNCNDIRMKVLLSAYILDSCDLLRVAAEMAGDQNEAEYVRAQIGMIKAA